MRALYLNRTTRDWHSEVLLCDKGRCHIPAYCGEPALPRSTGLDLAQEAHAQLLAALRRARYGYVLALHIVLWCAATRHPTEIAAVRFCSCSSVYRTMRAYRAGTLGLEFDVQGRLAPPVRTTVLTPFLQRSLLAWLKAAPHT